MSDPTLPGIPNIHSHAFQRAMAGLAERQGAPHDSFWTWRERMYGFAARLTPDTLRDIAAQLYVEMLEAGYTAVCEFHYLHHQPDGRPYADPAAMSLALVEAAREAGIRLTLLPVLYMAGGFDGRALAERQRRFGHDLPAYRRLVDALLPHEDATLRIGLAMHSLRAVPQAPLREVLSDRPGGAGRPLHIHIAEQVLEVEECVAARGARPVEWLLDHAEVDADWTLVHATHLSATEMRALAATPAVVAICTTTEANLGDGLFPLGDFLAAGGRIGVGSDSNVSVSPVEELRWLEYGQRLALRARNIAASASEPSVGKRLLEAAVAGGRQSAGQPGQEGDAIVLDGDNAWLAGVHAADLHDRFVFAGNQPLVREVRVGGRVVVSEGRHPRREAISARFRAAMRSLLAD